MIDRSYIISILANLLSFVLFSQWLNDSTWVGFNSLPCLVAVRLICHASTTDNKIAVNITSIRWYFNDRIRYLIELSICRIIRDWSPSIWSLIQSINYVYSWIIIDKISIDLESIGKHKKMINFYIYANYISMNFIWNIFHNILIITYIYLRVTYIFYYLVGN